MTTSHLPPANPLLEHPDLIAALAGMSTADAFRALFTVLLPEGSDRSLPGLGQSWNDLMQLLARSGADCVGRTEPLASVPPLGTHVRLLTATMEALDRRSVAIARFRTSAVATRAARGVPTGAAPLLQLAIIEARQEPARAILRVRLEEPTFGSLVGARAMRGLPRGTLEQLLQPRQVAEGVVTVVLRDGPDGALTLGAWGFDAELTHRMPEVGSATMIPMSPVVGVQSGPHVVSPTRFSVHPWRSGFVVKNRDGCVVWHHAPDEFAILQQAGVDPTSYAVTTQPGGGGHSKAMVQALVDTLAQPSAS